MNKKQDWLLLIHQLPPKPSNLRVRTWRRLRSIGSVSVKNAVYVLPFNDKTSEDFLWLKQEIASSGGEAAVFRADSVEGATDKEIVELFRTGRDEDYERLTGEFEGLTGAIREQKKGGSLSDPKLTQYETEFGKLRQELEHIKEIDFFHAERRKKAEFAFENCQKRLHATRTSIESSEKRSADDAKLNVKAFQNRRWVTRSDPHIDRLASGWLIKRFIDTRARFQFVHEGDPIKNALKFDMAEGDFTHRGEDCTFETLTKSFGLSSDPALQQIAEIVHDIDLKDKKFNRLESSGLNTVIRGLSALYTDDSERLKHCFPIFDGLYKLFGAKNEG